jgi:hypothetical protein
LQVNMASDDKVLLVRHPPFSKSIANALFNALAEIDVFVDWKLLRRLLPVITQFGVKYGLLRCTSESLRRCRNCEDRLRIAVGRYLLNLGAAGSFGGVFRQLEKFCGASPVVGRWWRRLSTNAVENSSGFDANAVVDSRPDAFTKRSGDEAGAIGRWRWRRRAHRCVGRD